MKTSRVVGAWVLWVLLLALGLPERAAAQQDPRDVKVERRVFPVKLSDGNTWSVVGYLYYQGSLENRPVQILTHGITYTHAYWDAPAVNGEDYSYARYMARRHYAVLALDMPGTGESDRPDGDFLNLAETASALSQVARQLRASGPRDTFQELIYVGHSNGALISTVAQALYGDAQAVVNTGWLNTFHTVPVGADVIGPLLQAGPYILLPGELRAPLFYAAGHADPDLIAYDNANFSDTLSRGQLVDLLTVLAYPQLIPVQAITVPVLVQVGDLDILASAAESHAEAAAYTGSPSVTVMTLSNTGHAFNTHYSREEGWARIDAWLRAR